jgi:hypothetical protein
VREANNQRGLILPLVGRVDAKRRGGGRDLHCPNPVSQPPTSFGLLTDPSPEGEGKIACASRSEYDSGSDI